MTHSRFVVYEAADGWRWRLLAGNHRIVADSGEAYASRAKCRRAVRRMLDLIRYDRVDVKVTE